MKNTGRKRKSISVEFHKEQMEFVNEMFNTSGCPMLRKMQKPSVVAAIIETHLKGGIEAASDFWKKVRDGDELGREDPRLKLRDYLGAESNVRRQDRNICIKAWNLYREKRTVDGEIHWNPKEGVLLPL